MTIIAAADGSSLGNPGPTGWAWYVSDEVWRAGGSGAGTNNIGELTAVCDLLESSAQAGLAGEDLVVLSDSQYVINAMTKWIHGWKRNGWRTAAKKPVANAELIARIDRALSGRRVEFQWVRGHAGHHMNEAADERARACARAYQRGEAPSEGPGWRAHPGASGSAEPAAPAEGEHAQTTFSAGTEGMHGESANATTTPSAGTEETHADDANATTTSSAGSAKPLLSWGDLGADEQRSDQLF